MPQLAATPTGRELEDFVAAHLQGTGHFLEKNIVEPNVLELDIVATGYEEGNLVRRLFEVKEGSAQWSDIFKVLGWMRYLGLERGAFLTGRPPQDQPVEFFSSRCAQVGMQFLVIEDIERAREVFEEAGLGSIDPTLHAFWRYSMWVERNLIEGLRRFARQHEEMAAPREALNYYRLVNDGIFFAGDAVERVRRLYDAYQAHPRLTAGAARELAGEEFDPEAFESTPQMQDALIRGRHVLLQACMYLEHRARLSILKAAVDYLAQGGFVRDTPGGVQIDFRAADLPQTFLRAFAHIQDQPGWRQYPLFWQIFLWGWGGLLLDDLQADDLAGLAEQSGLQEDEIPTALEAFNWFFPTDGGWIKRVSTASYQLVVMVPWPFQGLGAWQRCLRAGVDEYDQLGLTGAYTTADLARRHNSLVSLLDGTLDF